MKKLLILIFFTVFSCLAEAQSLPSINWKAKSDWINVKDFGAKGDGKTDDTKALQRAFDKLNNYVSVYIPPGRYIISDMIQWKGAKRLLGVSVIGHGKDTVLEWKGAKNGKMIRDSGLTLSRFIGFELDGNNIAAIGIWHDNNKHFETNIRTSFIALRNFRNTGICMEKNDGAATAEITFENCIFDNCGIGISFVSFNDYNYTFEGCLFKNNRFGIYAEHSNFYVRNCRFEANGTDIYSRPEHMSSVRRSVSVGSGVFLDYRNSVSPMIVENCFVSDWKSKDGAIVSAGAPLTVFDCVFKGKGAPINVRDSQQQIVISENTVIGGDKLFKLLPKNLSIIPKGKIKSLVLNEKICFLKKEFKVPQVIFDVKDYGARGDGRTDDTIAIQKAINAAAKEKGAIAYLPRGIYKTTDTLKISGKDFSFGGCGIGSKIKFVGAKHKNAIEVRDHDHITLSNFSFNHKNSDSSAYQADIIQFASSKASYICYDGIFSYGKYKTNPEFYGIRFKGLNKNDKVHLKYVEGNIKISDSGNAELLSNCSFEGTLVIENKLEKERNGFLAFMTRLVTLSAPCLLVRDNASLVISDFYVEQSPKENLILKGSPLLAQGRVTLGLAKMQKNVTRHITAIDCIGYNGTLAIVSGQFYCQKIPVIFKADKDAKVVVDIVGSCFYRYPFKVSGEKGLQFNMVGSSFYGKADSNSAKKLQQDVKYISDKNKISPSLDDLRKLGKLDLKYNYPEVYSLIK